MTLRNNVLAILESTFAGYKDELIESATDRIMWQFEHQTPDAFIVNGIRYAKAADTPQTDCDDRYAIRTDSGEVVAYACPLGCEQTDCGWGEPND